MEQSNSKESILILGLGNILLGDEGIGVRVVKELENWQFPDHIDLLDGGTGGFYILSVLEQYKTIIMIDATIDDSEPGSLALIEPEFASDFPKVLSSHDIGLRDLIESAALLEHLPKIYLITVSIHADQDINMKLSPEIQKTIPLISKMIDKLLADID